MTDAQFGIMIAAIAGIAGSLGIGFRAIFRWAVDQIVSALRSNEVALKESTKAMMSHEVRAEQFADKLEDTIEKIDQIAEWMENTPVETPSPEGRYRKHKKRRPTNPTIIVSPSAMSEPESKVK